MTSPISCLRSCLATCALLATLTARAADPSFTVQVPGADKMQITPPAAWTHNVDKAPPGIPPTIDFNLPGGAVLKVTFMPDEKGQFKNADALGKFVAKATQQYVDNSVEKRATLTRLSSNLGPGVYASFTDPKLANVAKLPPGEFRHVTSGAISAGRQVLLFFLVSNSRDSEEYRQVLDFLARGVAVAPAGS